MEILTSQHFNVALKGHSLSLEEVETKTARL